MRVERTANGYVLTIDEPNVVLALDTFDPQASEFANLLVDFESRGRAIATKQRADKYERLTAEDKAAVDAILANGEPKAAEATAEAIATERVI